MPARKYQHTPDWTQEDGDAHRRYLKGIRGDREREAHAKQCWFLRTKGGRKRPLVDAK